MRASVTWRVSLKFIENLRRALAGGWILRAEQASLADRVGFEPTVR